MGGILRYLGTPMTTIQGAQLSPLDLLLTLVSVLFFYILARVAARQFQKHLEGRLHVTGTNRRLLRSAVYLTVLLAGVYTSLSFLGVNLSILLVPLGALSIGLGLGLQNLASNYIAGLVLMTEGTIRDGDFIEVDGIRGNVLETSLRATVVKTFSNTEVIVPNSLMVAQPLDNWTKSDRVLRIDSTVGVAYGSDIGAVHKLLLAQIEGHEATLADPEPRTFLTEFADSALLFRLQYWIEDPAQRHSSLSEILEGIYHELNEQGIAIPFPQRDVWLKPAMSASHVAGAQSAHGADAVAAPELMQV